MGSLVKELRYTGTRATAAVVAVAATASAAPWLLRRLAAASQSSFQTRNFPLSRK